MKWFLLYFVIGFAIAVVFRVYDIATGEADVNDSLGDGSYDVCLIFFLGWGLIIPIILIFWILYGIKFLIKHLANFAVRIGKKKE